MLKPPPLRMRNSQPSWSTGRLDTHKKLGSYLAMGILRPFYGAARTYMRIMEAYRDSKTLLRMILFSIYQTGKYYPADLAKIQKHIDYLTVLYDKVLKDIIKLLKSI